MQKFYQKLFAVSIQLQLKHHYYKTALTILLERMNYCDLSQVEQALYCCVQTEDFSALTKVLSNTNLVDKDFFQFAAFLPDLLLSADIKQIPDQLQLYLQSAL